MILWSSYAFNLSQDTASSFPSCQIWAMDILCHCNVSLLSLWILWPAMHLEISAWPILMTREIRKWLEGAEGIFRQVGKGITWVEAPCSWNLVTVCFLPDHFVSLSQKRWPSHCYHLTHIIHSSFFFILSSNNSPRGWLQWHHSRQWDRMSVYFKAGNSVIIQR